MKYKLPRKSSVMIGCLNGEVAGEMGAVSKSQCTE